mmetsp:Transcript_76996/g.198276  ORF Transcript_76996/g.198276 Transcript_76996/m.198276 type:complete len:264 (-) Transcript_76996:114-905(-)
MPSGGHRQAALLVPGGRGAGRGARGARGRCDSDQGGTTSLGHVPRARPEDGPRGLRRQQRGNQRQRRQHVARRASRALARSGLAQRAASRRAARAPRRRCPERRRSPWPRAGSAGWHAFHLAPQCHRLSGGALRAAPRLRHAAADGAGAEEAGADGRPSSAPSAGSLGATHAASLHVDGAGAGRSHGAANDWLHGARHRPLQAVCLCVLHRLRERLLVPVLPPLRGRREEAPPQAEARGQAARGRRTRRARPGEGLTSVLHPA